ncbi:MULTISPECIES: LacI family DNA-binding transcriptional regulator [Actinoplanes]|uniref:LacI family DNA-binding transcriptional regulator n=1 Tax=Actinoplanes TaxID=1865 RepID=UPI0009F85D6F|nr:MULTISPECIES: LacI family DNA-binding transcriptional regulator [Actinoplanes]GLY07676.1 LacI family transcriptional regulator [Actinoplanes sp. NBRC 101535]
MPHPARPTVTLREVAAAAGVSVATASRVLGGSSRTVGGENARRVLEAAAALRYTVDVSARAMRRKSDAIALVADDLTTPSIAQVVAAMERRARAVDAFVTVSATRGDPARQLETVRTLCAFRPRALVITSSWTATTAYGARLAEELFAYERRGGRVVTYGDLDTPFDAIGVDDHGSARLVGEHLAATGHRRIVVLGGTRDRTFAAARVRGFTEGLGGGDVRVVDCEVSREGGYAATARLIAAGLGETGALVAVNDLVAIGALSACRAAGVDVPGRLSVTGFDDIPLAADVTPRLTTVAIPFAEIGARCIQLALTPGRAPERQRVTGTLVVRDSTSMRSGVI